MLVHRGTTNIITTTSNIIKYITAIDKPPSRGVNVVSRKSEYRG